MRLPASATALYTLVCIAIYCGILSCAIGARSATVQSPVSPQESLQQFVVADGLKIELVAHEPAVVDPVAIRFDENGRMWVVEMRDYPTAVPSGPRSRISVLEDRDGDGFFETATVFADGLPYATGVQPWRGGAFVTMAGKVAYMKDTSGDGRADVNETWFAGFAEENTQLRANHPRLALDNHIYIANGLRGGTVVDVRRPTARPLSISGRDFRFDPLTGQCEAVAGVGQFGLSFDDYGNRFVCTNRNPAMHIVLEDRHLKKNPRVAVPAVVHDVAKAAEASRVFPITRAWTTSNLHAGQFTAACGLEIYRGDALPRGYRGNLFVCEPTGHLVHREVMRPQGVTFTSSPAHEGVEFLASRDPWFSPVNLELGPDGALYVVDMYRAVIEHPEFMPEELRQRPDLRDGNDCGRIYRIVPRDFRRPPQPRLSASSSQELVELLSHPNAWWRETAARLILERQDKTEANQLRHIALHNDSPIARIHALWLLGGLELLGDEMLLLVLDDKNPHVVEQAIIAAEPHVSNSPQLGEKIAMLVNDSDPRVRFQSLLVAAPVPQVPAFPADSWELKAMLIATGDRGGTVLSHMLETSGSLKLNVRDPHGFIADLAELAATSQDVGTIAHIVGSLLKYPEFRNAALIRVLSNRRPRMTVEDVQAKLSDNNRQKLKRLIDDARRIAADDSQQDSARCQAIDLISLGRDAADVIGPLAISDPSQPIRLRAILALARTSTGVQFWQQLLDDFSSETPALQAAILDGLLADKARTDVLLVAVADDDIKPAQFDASRIAQLTQHRDPAISARARALFAEALPRDRQQALADYRSVLTMSADSNRGRTVFEKQCATCHRVGDVGTSFAPDISDSREKSAEQLLTDIVQPNRAVDANFFSYSALTRDGVTHTGVLAAETSTSITLKRADSTAITLRREDIDELNSNGVSLMPEGLERLIPPQDMADLISFIKNWRYLDDSQIQAQPGP